MRGARVRPSAPARRPRARLERQLDRLLPDGPSPMSTRCETASSLAVFLNEEVSEGARHRPRLPPRRTRDPDPTRSRALRRRALRPGGGRFPPTDRAARFATLARPLGLPPGEIERVARAVRCLRRPGSRQRGDRRRNRVGASRVAALARACGAGCRGARTSPSRFAASGRDGPIHPAADRDVPPCSRPRWRAASWSSGDKDSCADAGFLKIDLLGLGMLSAVRALHR